MAQVRLLDLSLNIGDPRPEIPGLGCFLYSLTCVEIDNISQFTAGLATGPAEAQALAFRSAYTSSKVLYRVPLSMNLTEGSALNSPSSSRIVL